MQVRPSIYRVSVTGNAFFDFEALPYPSWSNGMCDVPIQYASQQGANVLFQGSTADMPPDLVTVTNQNWHSTLEVPVQAQECGAGGGGDAWMCVYANAEQIDSIARYVAWVNPRVGTLASPSPDIPFDAATCARINRGAWYYTPFGVPYWGSLSPWLNASFKEFRHAFRAQDLSSTAGTWGLDCDEIDVNVSIDTNALTYVPKSIKVTNNATLPTFFCLSAGKGLGGHGVTDPNALGSAGNKGQFDYEDKYLTEYFNDPHVFFEDGQYLNNVYPHASGFVDVGSSSAEKLIDNKFEYIVMQAFRPNAPGGSADGTEMVSEFFLISEAGLDDDIREFWSGWAETGYVEHLFWPFGRDYPYGKLHGHNYRLDAASSNNWDTHGGRNTMRFHEVIVGSFDKNSNIELRYSEPETYVDTLTASSIEQAQIPSNYTPGGSLNLATATNTDILFGPYDGYHFKFDLISGAVCKENGHFDNSYGGTMSWEYSYHFYSPFEKGADVFTWGGFSVHQDKGVPCIPIGRSACAVWPYCSDSANSGFRCLNPEPGTDPMMDGVYAGPYSTQQIFLPAGIVYVNGMQQSTSVNYNRDGEGPFLREGLFEMSIPHSDEMEGHIIGLFTDNLTCYYDALNGALDSYEQVYISEPISIDVYRVDHEVSYNAY